MKHFIIAALAFASATASANIQHELNGVIVTANVDSGFFDTYKIENTGINQWHILATIDLLQHEVPEFTFNFAISNKYVGDYIDGYYSTSASAHASELVESLPTGAFLFSKTQPVILAKSSSVSAYRADGSYDLTYTASANKSLGGGYGLLPSDNPNCQNFSCMTPFQLKNTFVFEAYVQTIPEPATVGMALAGGLIVPIAIALRRRKKSS